MAILGRREVAVETNAGTEQWSFWVDGERWSSERRKGIYPLWLRIIGEWNYYRSWIIKLNSMMIRRKRRRRRRRRREWRLLLFVILDPSFLHSFSIFYFLNKKSVEIFNRYYVNLTILKFKTLIDIDISNQKQKMIKMIYFENMTKMKLQKYNVPKRNNCKT